MRSDLVYDVGMHKGEDTDYYLRKGFRVIGFEANPELIKHCKLRFRDAISTGRLSIIDGAIAPASAGPLVKFFLSSISVWGTTEESWAKRNSGLGAGDTVVYVPRVNIKDIYAKFGVPFYLKIDIEGMDSYVLTTLRDLKEKPEFISIESNKVDFHKLVDEIGLLCSLGYTKFRAVQQQTIPNSEVCVTTLEGEPFVFQFEKHATGTFGDDLEPLWLSASELVDEYKTIFKRYHYFGDQSLFRKLPRRARGIIRKIYELRSGYCGPLPGWYDTHAKR